MKEFIWKYKFTIVSVILVLIAILMPSDDVPSVSIPHLDKVVHCGMFGFVTLCYYWDYYQAYRKAPHVVKVMIAVILFGALTEVMQACTPSRSCDIKDLLADAIGVILATGVARWAIAKYKQIKEN